MAFSASMSQGTDGKSAKLAAEVEQLKSEGKLLESKLEELELQLRQEQGNVSDTPLSDGANIRPPDRAAS